MTDEPLTKPEQAAERMLAKRVKKRMDVKRDKHGTCYLCVHRDKTYGAFHCKRDVGRQYPLCDRDGQAPKFQFDDKLLPEFADAA